MLKTPTLFILGAGSSFDLGMPLGKALATEIASKIDIKFRDGHEQVSGDHAIMDALRTVARSEGTNVNEFLAAGRLIAGGIGFTRSIDSFLHKHENDPKVLQCAKLAIAHSILEHERKSSLYIDHTRGTSAFRNPKAVMSSWLEDFFYLLQDGVSKSHLSRLLSNLMIIDFNYDRCLEQFLINAICRVYQKGEAEVAELLNEHLNIIHPYGTLGGLPWQNRQMNCIFGGSENVHPQELIRIAKGIKTFNEEMSNNEMVSRIREMVETAGRVCFLGFHFHNANMELLKISRNGSDPEVYATAFERSASGEASIRECARKALDIKSTNSIHVDRHLHCKGFFAEYGDILA